MVKITQEIFLARSRDTHGDRYDYSKAVFAGVDKKLEIICSEHGSFYQGARSHWQGQGCPSCGAIQRRTSHNLTNKEFLERAYKTHGNYYDYTNTKYINNRDMVTIRCRTHGDFTQLANSHLAGHGCYECGRISTTTSLNSRCVDILKFIKKSKEVHNNKYDYSLTAFRKLNERIIIKCHLHGSFAVTAHRHITRKQGCPLCRPLCSKGEIEIRELLDKQNIKYEHQKSFKDCINEATNRKLWFDIYIPEMNTIIEYDGAQHFRPVSMWGGIEEFDKIKIRDSIKNEYCKINNINLIRISYKQNIEQCLINFGIISSQISHQTNPSYISL